MNKGTILSVDDDKDLQFVIEQYLEENGYNVVKANDTKTALERIKEINVDAILLDLVLPDGEGMTLIPQFKAISEAAIIVVSGKSDTTEKIICLEMGADDYITKPFEMRELTARLKAVQRRMEGSTQSNNRLQSGNNHQGGISKSPQIFFENGWCLDREQYQLLDHDKKSLELTTGEFQLLEAMVLSSNRALTRERLFELTRDGDYDIYDRAIDIQIARLRKKIANTNKNAEPPGEIKTVRGVGYMFMGNFKK